MIVEKIKIKKAVFPISVHDAYVDKGLVEGGHSALPDIDVDYASDRRQEIKEYLEERYNVAGAQRVFSAGTFSTMKLKAVLKDVARVHRVPHSTVNYITAIFDDNTDWTGLFKLAAVNRKVNRFIQDYPQVVEDIRFLMGQPRSASIHASAIIVTPDSRNGEPAECFDFLPIRKMDGLLVSEFDGYAVDEIGLLKEDVLATKELSKLSAVIDIINRTYGKEYSIERITREELEDQKTYQLLAEGYTQNVFQFASRGITRFLKDIQPDCIEDLIAANALYRPATLEIGATDDYIRYKRGEAEPVYNYGTYEITKNTYGIMCYQEQFMQIAHTLGGFDLGKTDYLRKAIGKKNAELMASLKADFITGAVSNGCPEYEAEDIWHKIETAGKYGLNRSHAAAYALTAYCGAWLKANYPSAFYTVALQWVDDKEVASIMAEMEQCSRAKIVPPDINRSGAEFFTDYATDEIYWSLVRIKMLGGQAAQYIIAERDAGGGYASLEDFIRRIFRKKVRGRAGLSVCGQEDEGRMPVTTRHLKNMILSGCFDTVEGIGSDTERYGLLRQASDLTGMELKEDDFPSALLDRQYFWAMKQIETCGIGSIDYRRIYDCSEVKALLKGRVSYCELEDVQDPDNDGKRVVVCATAAQVDECRYTDKETGDEKKFCKILLQQNNTTAELVVWNDQYLKEKALLAGCAGKILIVSAVVKYSAFTGCNALNSYKSSIIKIV